MLSCCMRESGVMKLLHSRDRDVRTRQVGGCIAMVYTDCTTISLPGPLEFTITHLEVQCRKYHTISSWHLSPSKRRNFLTHLSLAICMKRIAKTTVVRNNFFCLNIRAGSMCYHSQRNTGTMVAGTRWVPSCSSCKVKPSEEGMR